MRHYDYGFRIYNPAVGRFLSVDPLTKSYPELTPYQFASNTPIAAIDLDGLEAWIIHHYHSLERDEPEIQLEYDKNLENPGGVYTVHHYPGTNESLPSSTWGSASYSEFPNLFPNFSKGIYEQPERQDGRSLITFEGHGKLTLGTIGANAEVLGREYGPVLKSEADLWGREFRVDSDRLLDGGATSVKKTSILTDNTIDFGVEGGYLVGLGYKREFDSNSGKFLPTDEFEYSAGLLPVNVISNTFSNETSIRFGGGLKAGAALGFDLEAFIYVNPPLPRIDFSKYEMQMQNANSPSDNELVLPDEKF